MLAALRIAFVAGCTALVVALVLHWFAPALATGELAWIVAFVVWLPVFAAAAMLAALSVWEWLSLRTEEVVPSMK